MEIVYSLAGVLTALALGAMSPGPSFLMVAQISVSGSRREGVAAALGMGAGGVIFALLVLFGLHAILTAVPWLYAALKVIGALYLIYLGLRVWRAGTISIAGASETTSNASLRSAFFRALLTQLSNPKTAVVYGSIFAALLPPDLPRVALWLLPCVVFLIEAGWYSIVALALSAAAPRNAYLSSKPLIDRITGSVMIFLGLKLLFRKVAT